MKVLLYGVNPFNQNRGVNALTYGAIEVIQKKYPNAEIILLNSANQGMRSWKGKFQKGEFCFNYYTFTFGQFIIAFINKLIGINLLWYANKKFRFFQKDLVNAFFEDIDVFCNVNEGDSFSDLYGERRFFRHAFASLVALKNRKKVVFLPQTVGPFKHPLVKFMAKYILNRLDCLYVRDLEALEFLDDKKIPYNIAKDISLCMTPVNPGIDISADNYIAINVSGLMYFDSYNSLKGRYQVYPGLLVQLCHYFQKLEKTVLLVPHTYSITSNEPENDYQAIVDFVAAHNDLKNVEIVDKELTAPEIKYVISNSEFFIGSRMHACFAALTTSTPCFGLGYSYKFRGGFETFGIGNLGIDISDLGSDKEEKIFSMIVQAYNNRSEIRASLENNNKKGIDIDF